MNTKAVIDFLQSAPRHKIIVLGNNASAPNVPTFDIGQSLSSYIVANNIKSSVDISMLVNNEFLRLFNDTVAHTEEFGNAIQLENFGLTFEPALGLDMRTLIKDLSRNVAIFIKWPGEIIGQKLMFLTSKSPEYIDLADIHYHYEI